MAKLCVITCNIQEELTPPLTSPVNSVFLKILKSVLIDDNFYDLCKQLICLSVIKNLTSKCLISIEIVFKQLAFSLKKEQIYTTLKHMGW